MAKKRTKKAKKLTAQRRKKHINHLQVPNKSRNLRDINSVIKLETTLANVETHHIKAKKEKTVNESISLLSYDPKLLKQDLMKTVILSMGMFGVLVGLYFYLR